MGPVSSNGSLSVGPEDGARGMAAWEGLTLTLLALKVEEGAGTPEFRMGTASGSWEGRNPRASRGGAAGLAP